MPPSFKQRHKRLNDCADDITRAAMDLWWDHQVNGTSDCVAQLKKALPSLAELNRFYKEQGLLFWLAGMVRAGGDNAGQAADALGAMGEKAATEAVLAALVE